ncbi:MAG: response regulator [Actinomycetota bacterium]
MLEGTEVDMPVRVVVVDDTSHVLDMLVSMLTLDGFDVVGSGGSGEQAVDLATRLQPDVIVIDYMMPGMDGLSAARKIRAAVPTQSIILYTAFLDDTVQQEARAAGVALCVGKVEGLETLEQSITELCLQISRE